MPCHFEDHPTAPVTPTLSLVAIDRNRWSRSIGIGGRDQSEQVVAISRNAQPNVKKRPPRKVRQFLPQSFS
jgi:hypothetical protein